MTVSFKIYWPPEQYVNFQRNFVNVKTMKRFGCVLGDSEMPKLMLAKADGKQDDRLRQGSKSKSMQRCSRGFLGFGSSSKQILGILAPCLNIPLHYSEDRGRGKTNRATTKARSKLSHPISIPRKSQRIPTPSHPPPRMPNNSILFWHDTFKML